MPSITVIRDVSPDITTFTIPFNRFAPFGYRKFVAVGNRATAIRLHDKRILLLYPVPLEPLVRRKLDELGGVHFIAGDLGHHMYIKDYQETWPNAKVIGVQGLNGKRKDITWNFIYRDARRKPEDEYNFAQDVESILFEGFITYTVAWYHKPTKTLIQSDLLMNLPCTEQYKPSSADQDILSRGFAKHAHPWSFWFRCLIYYVACVDQTLMQRDVRRVIELDIQRIIPCHGDILEEDGNDAFKSVYRWQLNASPRPSILRRIIVDPFMKVVRWFFLM